MDLCRRPALASLAGDGATRGQGVFFVVLGFLRKMGMGGGEVDAPLGYIFDLLYLQYISLLMA